MLIISLIFIAYGIYKSSEEIPGQRRNGADDVENFENVLEDVGTEKIFQLENITIISLYNNYGSRTDLQTGWGFSCLIKTLEEDILFDTGGNGEILMKNMEKLDLDAKKVDLIFLSHIHGDHVGGLWNFLELNSDLTVYGSESFPRSFKKRVEEKGADFVSVGSAENISKGVWSTGELTGPPLEQSMVISTKEGLVVVTGCAHPGIVSITEKCKRIGEDNILLVMGGFHLSGASDYRLRNILSSFHDLGVKMVAPSHCSGDACRDLFEEDFDENYIEDGVGNVITI